VSECIFKDLRDIWMMDSALVPCFILVMYIVPLVDVIHYKYQRLSLTGTNINDRRVGQRIRK